MSDQCAFEFDKPRSRNTDPRTSREAEARNREAMKGQRKAVFDLIRQMPGRSAREICDATGYSMHVFSRRAAELFQMGRIRRLDPHDAKRRGLLLWPTEPGARGA
jgi:DNA-binding MarR family transcriptional regulator